MKIFPRLLAILFAAHPAKTWVYREILALRQIPSYPSLQCFTLSSLSATL